MTLVFFFVCEIWSEGPDSKIPFKKHVYVNFNYLKVRDYQADSERQKQLNDIKKKNEEDVLAHLNDLENNLLITGNFLSKLDNFNFKFTNSNVDLKVKQSISMKER